MSENQDDQQEMNMADDYVLDQLTNFTKVIKLHQAFDNADVNPPDFCPKELEGYVDFDKLHTAWKFRSYDVIRRMFAQGWIDYADNIIHEKASLSADDLCLMTNAD